MSGNVNIKRGDLHLAISAAFTRGRYVLMTGGDGEPREITIDLRERPDDLFGAEPESATDDHGPAIPAQGRPGPIVYEFALQDIDANRLDGWPPMLTTSVLKDAPDQAAASTADWVHVYDRVTRERRTLKRPAPDAILTGLQDVAESLRGRPVALAARAHGKSEAVRAAVEAAIPPVGPLTSTEGLRAGDVLRALHPYTKESTSERLFAVGAVVNYAGPAFPKEHLMLVGFDELNFGVRSFAFVGRPDADGWMTWAGGDNPVPGAVVEVRTFGKGEFAGKADNMDWRDMGESGHQIVAFRIVDNLTGV